MPEISFSDFTRVTIHAGTVVRAEPFPEARQPAYKLWIDFGPELGERKSSAQITARYKPADLIGRQVLAVTNLGKKQIGPIQSECLVLGFPLEGHEVVLAAPEAPVPPGTRLL